MPNPADTVTPATPEEIRQEIIAWVKAEVKAYESAVAAAAATSGVSDLPAT